MNKTEYHITQTNVIESLHQTISRIRNNYKAGYLTKAEADAEIETTVKSYLMVSNNLIELLKMED